MSFQIAYTYEIIDKFSAPLSKIESAAKRVDKRLGRLTGQTRNSVKAMSQFSNVTKGQRDDIDNYGRALGRASQEAQGLNKNLKGIPKKFPKVPAGAGSGAPGSGLSDKLEAAKSRAAGLRGQIMDTAAMAALFALPIRQAILFESSMADVKKVLNDITPDQLIGLEQTIKDLGVSTGLGARGVADIVAAGGRLGIAVESLPDFTTVVSRASVAFDMLPEAAGDALASISNKMKIPISDIGQVADAINHLSDTTAAKAPNMIEILGRTAGTMSLLKMPPEVAAGFASFADQVEVSAQLGASGLNMMINRMEKVPALQKKLLEDPKKAIMSTLQALEKLDDSTRINVIQDIFGDEAGRFVKKAVSNLDLLEDTLGKVADKTQFAGSMTREFEVRMATTEGGLNRMSSSLGVAAVNLGAALLPAINEVTAVLVTITSGIASFAQEFPMLTTFIMGTMAALIALRLAFLVSSFIMTQFKIIMIGAQVAMTAFKMASLGLAGVPTLMAAIRVAALAMSLQISAAGGAVGLFKFALKGLMAATGIGLLVLAVTTIMEHWESIVGSVKEAASWISGIFGSSDVAITQEQEVTAITEEAKAKAQAQANTLNGQITVAAAEGSRVVSAEAETTGADLGFNMGAL